MTLETKTNTDFLNFLRVSFTACEWHGLICRCFGPHNTEYPLLIAQEAYVVQISEWAYSQPANRFFFEELLRLRPKYKQCIHLRMDELELTIRRRPNDESDDVVHTLDKERFVLAENGMYSDLLTGLEHSHFQISVVDLDDSKVQMIYEDILAISQLPIASFQKVTAIDLIDDVIHLYSTALGAPINTEVSPDTLERYLFLLAEALDAAHQRYVFHGPIHFEHLRSCESTGLLLGGFGESALSGKYPDINADYAAFASVVEMFYPVASKSMDVVQQLRDGVWGATLVEVVPEIQNFFKEPEVLSVTEQPARLVLDSANHILVNLGFQSSKHIVNFSRKGVGDLKLDVAPLPPWMEMIPKRIDPDIQEQRIELIVHPKKLPSNKCTFEWVIRHLNEELDADLHITIEARRSTWLVPVIFISVLLAIIGLLVLSRMAA